MRAASFFTGAGGFDIGLEKAGVEIVFQCERDKNCLKLLNEKYPNVTKHDDITTIKPEAIPEAQIYCGGFPCQDLSVAKHGQGLAGAKSSLFFKFAEIIKANTPQWILLENVPNLLYTNQGQDFQTVLETLAECGYSLSWRVLDSQYFGIPQRRRRLFIVGHLGNWEKPARALFETEFKVKNARQSSKSKSTVTSKFKDCLRTVETQFLNCQNRQLHLYENLAHTLTASRDSSVVSIENYLRYFSLVEKERLQGFPDHWTAGFSKTVRNRMIGNAVSVPVAQWLGQRILEAEMSNE